ncbi:unnamed protein product [Rhizophagus irregularis]|uniref:Uncharacterized protein n=1 Tax=Rhizophagus irregularis TaxID=588596 RepID=A0A916E4R2_9GLOM|nr:unnamed protein product [Rhizophagus irregularis]
MLTLHIRSVFIQNGLLIFAYSSYSSIESIWLEILRSNHKENFDASAGSKIIIFSGSMQQLLRLFSSNSSIESW